MAAFVLSAFLLTAPAPSQSATAASAVSIPFKVCEESLSWTRPPENIQATKWDSPRVGLGVNQGRKLREWTHEFILDSNGSADLDQESVEFSGMWTAQDLLRLCDGTGEDSQVAAGKGVAVWSLLHRVESIRLEDKTFTVVVGPANHGFQKVYFSRPEGLRSNFTFIFLDAQGQELDRVTEIDRNEQDSNSENFSGRVTEVAVGSVTLETPNGAKRLALTSTTTYWNGKSAIEVGDRISGTATLQSAGTLVAIDVAVNRVDTTGYVESASSDRIFLAPGPLRGPRRGQIIQIEIGPETKIDSKENPAGILAGSFVRITGTHLQDGAIHAAEIMMVPNPFAAR